MCRSRLKREDAALACVNSRMFRNTGGPVPSNMIDATREGFTRPVNDNGAHVVRDDVMERFQQSLPDVWREVSRHIEIGESAETLFRLLRAFLPISRLAVYRLDQEHRRLIVAAVAPTLPSQPLRSEEVAEWQFRKLVAWIRTGDSVRLDHRGA